MELSIGAILDSLDVPAVIGLLLVGGVKVMRRLDSLIIGVDGIKKEQTRIADELAQHKVQDREDFRAVHERLDNAVSRR